MNSKENNQKIENLSPTSKSSPGVTEDQIVTKKNQLGCIVHEAAVEDIRKAREDIELRRKDLVIYESELKAREKAISEEIKKLENTRELISKSQEVKKIEYQKKVSKLIETFLTMSPKSSAKVLSTLDDRLAVLVVSEMETTRLAKIMNLMDPKRSSHLSELIAGVKK